MNNKKNKELSRLLNLDTNSNSKDLIKLCKLMISKKKDDNVPIDVLKETIDSKEVNL